MLIYILLMHSLKIKCFGLFCMERYWQDQIFSIGDGGHVSCPCCNSILETIDHLFIRCSRMHDFWDSFNLHNNYSFHVPLTSVGNIWNYECSLLKLQKILFLSLYSVVLWVRWNERNKAIFQHHSLMSFNAFVIKVSHLFSMWTEFQFSLTNLCRIHDQVMVRVPWGWLIYRNYYNYILIVWFWIGNMDGLLAGGSSRWI
jgi:hypothetical protein